MTKRYYADLRVDVRVYFTDNGEDDLNDQAVEALDAAMIVPDEEGVCEGGGIEVICVHGSEAHD